MQRITVKKFEDGKFPKVYIEGDKYYWNLDGANPFLADTLRGSEGKSFEVEFYVKSVPGKDGKRGFNVNIITSAQLAQAPAQTAPPLKSKQYMPSDPAKEASIAKFNALNNASSLANTIVTAMASTGKFHALSQEEIENFVYDYWERAFTRLKALSGVL